MKPPVVIIPVRDKLDLTQSIVEALIEDGGYSDLIVFDNGSKDGTWNWLRTQHLFAIPAPKATLHEMWNRGLHRAAHTGAPAVILNNDIEIDDKADWLERLCAPLKDGWSVTCPNYDGRGGVFPVESLRGKGVCGHRYNGTGGLAGFAFAMAPDIAASHRFPTEAMWWFGDTDLVLTMEDQNHDIGLVRDVGVTHLDGGSQTTKEHDLSEQFKQDQEWFENKWGITV